MEEAAHTGQHHTEKLDDFINFRLSKADRIKLEVVARGNSLGSTLRELIDEAYSGITESAVELARLRKKKGRATGWKLAEKVENWVIE